MEVDKYLGDIGIVGVLKDRVIEIINHYKILLPNQTLKNIFVNDYINESNLRSYTSVVLLYENVLCEAKNFTSTTEYDWASFDSNSILYWEIKSKKNDFENFGDESRLSLRIKFQETTNLELKAAKNNCKYLMSFFKELLT